MTGFLRDLVTPARAAVLAAVLAATAAGGVFVRGGPETYEVTAQFPRAIALFPGSVVRVKGVDVGDVTAVVPSGDRVRVDMRISEEIRVPADATAIIVPISLIADRYVQLEPVWEGGPTLDDGDTIPLERGVAPAELDDLLNTLQEFLQAIEPGTAEAPGALGQLIQNADQALSGQGQELGGTVDGLSTVLDVLGRNTDHLDRILVNADQLLGPLATRDAELAATNRGLASVLSALAEERDALESGLGNLALLTEELGGLVEDHQDDLTRDLQILKDVTDALVRQREFLVRNTRWLPVLMEGTLNAFDPEHEWVRVRDTQSIRGQGGSTSSAAVGFEPPPLGPGPGVDGEWLLWPPGGEDG